MRPTRLECLGKRWSDTTSHLRCDCQGNRLRGVVSRCRRQRLCEKLDCGVCTVTKACPGRGQHRASPVAYQQLSPKVLFQFAQLDGNRWLCHIKGYCCPANVTCLSHAEEIS